MTEAIIVSLDPAGMIQVLNRRGHELLGFPDQSLIGKNWFTLVLPAERQKKVVQEHNRVMAGDLQPIEYVENDIVIATG